MTGERTQGELWRLFRGALVTRLFGIAADLGVADALADGPRRVDELARELGAAPAALHRMLRALASEGVFVEEAPGVFRSTDASEGLRPGTRRHDFAHLFGGRERSEVQWRALLEENGFDPVRVEDGLIEARCR